jgi:hypothetical protein
MAREYGLNMRPDVARRIADASGCNRAIIAQELEKFAIFLDAAPERPKPLENDVLDVLGAASEEGDLSRLVDSVSGGDSASLQAELLRLSSEGIEGIALIRAMLRRMSLLSKLRAKWIEEIASTQSWRHMVRRCSGGKAGGVAATLPLAVGYSRQGNGAVAGSGTAGEGPWRPRPDSRGRRAVRNLPPSRAAALDPLAAETLTDHIELIEGRIAERHYAAVRPVGDLDPEAKHVAKLPLQSLYVRACALIFYRSLSLARLFRSDELFGVAHREIAPHHLIGQGFRILCGDECPRVPHAELPTGDHQPHGFGQIQQAEQVRNMASRLMNQLAKRFLRMAELIEQPL